MITILDLVHQPVNYQQFKMSANDVLSTIVYGMSEFVVMASDTETFETVLFLSVIEDKNWMLWRHIWVLKYKVKGYLRIFNLRTNPIVVRSSTSLLLPVGIISPLS